MKSFRTIFVFIIIGGISFYACSKLFSPFSYTSHDGPGHLIRMLEFHEAVKDGQLPVRIAKRINFGLGYPFFTFNYPLLYYVGEGFVQMGATVLDAYKLLMIAAVLFSGFSFYLWLAPYFGTIASLMGALFWIIAPYKFLNMYVRGNLAESIGLAMVSLGLLAVDRYMRKSLGGYAMIAFFALFILSHNITVLIGLPLLFVYGVWITRSFSFDSARFVHMVLLLIPALCMTAFFWLPAAIEAPLTQLAELRTDYKTFFPTARDIIYSPWGFGSFAKDAVPGKMSVQVGLVHTLMTGLAVLLLFVSIFRKKHKPAPKDRIALFAVCVLAVSVFLTLDISRPVWDAVPFLPYVQIPWRFVGYATLAASILAAYTISKIPGPGKLYISVTLVSLLLYANRNHVRVNLYVPFDNPFTASQIYGPSTTSKDEHMPIWAPHIYETPNQNGDIFPPSAGMSKRDVWQSNAHKFTVTFAADGEFRDNTSYYPGWTAQVDNKPVPIRYRDDPFGRLRISVPRGVHTVSFRFGEPPHRQVANSVSVITLVGFGSAWIWAAFLSKKTRRGILPVVETRADPEYHRGSILKKPKKGSRTRRGSPK